MAPPKPSTVLLILLLAVLVTVFVVGAVLGAQDRPMPTRERIEAWAGAWLAPSPIQAADLRWEGGEDGAGASPLVGRIRGGRTAVLHVAASSKRQRALTLVTGDALGLVVVRAAMPDMPIRVDTRQGERSEVELQLDGQGGHIEIACARPGDQGCTVRVE